MFKLYLITAWRNLKKNRVVSLINITGLTIGLTCALFAIIFSHHELSYENCHEKADRICMVYTHGKFGSLDKVPVTFGAAATDLQGSFPEIEIATRSITTQGIVYKETKPLNEDDILISEKTIFSLFDFNFISGTIPQGPNTVVISDKMARKYFGTNEPYNETLDISIHGKRQSYTVAGIFKELPNNTHLKASIIIPFDLAYDLHWHPDEHWSTEYSVYTLLNPGTDIKMLNLKIAQMIEIPVQIENIKYVLVPIKRIHLFENIAQNARSNLIMILTCGFLALIITLFNYINTSTLMFSSRIKEIGIRKTNGGNKRNIFAQFLSDAGISVSISFALSILLFYTLLPYFNQIVDTDITSSINGLTILILIGIYFLTIVISSLYPATKSLRVKTISMIRDTPEALFSKSRLRNVLITIQFVLAILFLQIIIITQKQTNYQFSQDVRKFDPEDVICMDGNNWGDLNTVKHELLENKSIQMVSWGQALPGAHFSMTSEWKSSENTEMANSFKVEKDFLDIFKIQLLEGRFFTDDYSSDADNSIVINPLAAKSLDYKNPIGKTVLVAGKQYTIIGITDEYLSVPPMFDRMPLLIGRAGNKGNFLFIRVNPAQRSHAHKHIEKVLSRANPDYPINIKYYNDIVYDAAKSFIATGIFTTIFTGIIIFNAMMGLFGLSFFISERKTKEIGIRKVCGAKMKDVFWSLSIGFLKKLVLALAITFPIGYIFGGHFVSQFTDKVDINAGIFILAGSLTCFMVMISIGWKIMHTAIQNPVKALRYE